MLKGYVTPENIYYEALGKLNPIDIEVPLRRPQNTTPPMLTATQPPIPTQNSDQNLQQNYGNYQPQNNLPPQREDRGMFGNIGWKDLITFIYFLSGVAALWVNMSERTLIMEQRLNSIERDSVTVRETIKEMQGKTESQIRASEKDISELRYDMLKHGKR